MSDENFKEKLNQDYREFKGQTMELIEEEIAQMERSDDRSTWAMWIYTGFYGVVYSLEWVWKEPITIPKDQKDIRDIYRKYFYDHFTFYPRDFADRLRKRFERVVLREVEARRTKVEYIDKNPYVPGD